MNNMKKLIAVILMLVGICMNKVFAQAVQPDSIVTDSLPAFDTYLQQADLTKARPFPYPKSSMANIRLYARVWRVIDLADSSNAILAIPGHSLMETIMKAIQKGKLTPYEKDDFKKKLSARQGEQRFADSVLVPKFDKDGNQISSRMVLNDFNPDRITKFRIEEDVFFDRQRGRVDTRIIGLAPMMTISGSADLPANMSSTPAFWLYFPQLRFALVQEDVSDPDKEVFDVTLDDVFMQHKFSAYLIKQFTPGRGDGGQLDPGSPEALKLEQKIAELKKNIWKSPKGVNDKNLVTQTKDKKEGKP
jgi:gliding motility associated protien GldN